MPEKLTKEEFTRRAIINLRKLPKYKGIHTVYSGFNSAFKKYFPGEDPVVSTQQLVDEGKIILRPVKGGVMIFLPEDHVSNMESAEMALGKILGEVK